ncbi:MAG: PAS domain S-box protein [Kiloniellales bacterium]
MDTDRTLLDLVIETAPDAIVTIDGRGKVLSFSPAAERMFGYSPEEVLGRNISCLMPAPHRQQHDGYLARYKATGEKRVIGIGRQVQAQRKNGEIFVAEIAVGEWCNDGQHVFTGFIRDLTDRLEAERKAARLQRMLDRLSRVQMLGEMSSALAHEISQPLAAITSFARATGRVLGDRDSENDKARLYLDRIATEALRAGEILKRMQQLVERGKADLRPQDINELMRESVALSNLQPDQASYEIRFDLADDLPPVLADRIQIQQVIINLLRNAAEANGDEDQDDVHVSTALFQDKKAISVHAKRNDADEVLVTIGDGGPGLPEEISERLFEPFVTTKENGLGIGLAVCRTIIKAHNGKIWADTNAEGGADFHFTLPVAAMP